MKYSILLLLCFAVTSLNLSQQLVEQWSARYNGTANNMDLTSGLAVDNQGCVYVTGFGYNTGTSRDYITIKYNPNGTIAWVKTYNGETNGGDYSLALGIDNQNNVYVTGRSDRGGPTFSDITTIKYSTTGVQQWVAFYNGPASGVDEACCIKVDGNGNVYVAGRSDGGIATNEDMVVVKYDNNGNQLWAKRYDGSAHNVDRALSIDVDTQGNVLVCGTALNAGSGSDYVVIKYNSSGTEQWVKTYNGLANGGDIANVVKTDLSNYVYATGFEDNGIGRSYDYFTVKINPDGVTQWTSAYNGQGNQGDFPSAMVVDNSGNVYVTGKSTGSSFINDSNYATVKYNSQGVQQWVAIYKGSNSSIDVARSIALDDDGNVYVTGGSSGSNMTDYITIKYKNGGLQEWVLRYNGPGNGDDFSSSVVADALHNVYVTGCSYGAGTNLDFATIKYSVPLGISHNGSEIPDRFELNQNYPNPFNPTTMISFSLPKQADVKLSVFDLGGKEIGQMVNSTLSAGNYSVGFDGREISSGIYFYRLEAGEFTDTKKMILIK